MHPAARISRVIDTVIDTLAIAMLVVMVCAMTWQVFGRYVLGRSPAWAEELARYMMVWLTFLGAAAVLRSGSHLTVTALVDHLGPRGKAVLMALRDVLMFGLCVTLAWASWKFAAINAAQESAAMEIPMSVPNFALVLGFSLLALQIVLARLAGQPFPALAGDEF
jgi:TRAP-type C4-dicarboxylate transport system permease small subunit